MVRSSFVIVASAAAALAFAQGALAADLPVKARPYVAAPQATWTGFYLGGQVGWVHSDVDNSPFIGPFAFAAPGIAAGSQSADAITGGLHIGYNYQVSSFVYGIEADFNWPGVSTNTNYVINPATPAITLAYTVNSKIDHYGTIRGRFGTVAALPNTLLYVTGGWAYGQVKNSMNGFGAFSGTAFTTNSSNDHSGWTVGFGADYMIAHNWIVGIEYKHTDLGSETNSYVLPAGTITSNADLTLDEVTARLAYKF
jgi:outer membrane immunogenic protein